jgi:hypothetical protein
MEIYNLIDRSFTDHNCICHTDNHN